MQKQRGMWRLFVVLVVALTVIWLGACSAPEPSEPEMEVMEDTVDGEAMLQASCTKCHDLERTTSKQKTRDQWSKLLTTLSRRVLRLQIKKPFWITWRRPTVHNSVISLTLRSGVKYQCTAPFIWLFSIQMVQRDLGRRDIEELV